MESLELLESIKKQRKNVEVLELEMKFIKESSVIKSSDYSMTNAPNNGSSVVQGVVLKLEKVEEQLKKEKEKEVELKMEVFNHLSKLKINGDTNDYFNVLFSKYFNLLSFDEVAVEMNLSKRHVYRVHHKAILEFEKILKKK